MLKVNVAGWDRILRVSVGAVLLYLAWVGTFAAWVGAVLMVVGIVLVLTGLVGWCPLYALLGVSTNHRARTGARPT